MSAVRFRPQPDRFIGKSDITGPQGNHGEDVKELYWYIDNTPTHSLMRMIYRYPQNAFPYDELVAQSGARSKMEGESELWETGVLSDNRFFDIEIDGQVLVPPERTLDALLN